MKAWFNKWFSDSKRPQSKPVTYFVHVPKTAGTSFIVLLDRFFAAATIFPQQLWREIKQIDQQANQNYDLYRGHLGGGGLKVLTNRPIEYLTLLRNPIELAQSTYEYVLRETNTKVHQLVKDRSMDFAEFLQHPMTQPLIKNRMIRNISFDFKQDPAAQEVFLSAETIEFLHTIINNRSTTMGDDQRLQRAVDFIHKCRWFGLLERFDESMQLLCFEMAWPPIGPSQKLNVYAQKPQLPDSVLQQLAAINQHDFALYREAEKLFEAKLHAMHSALEKNRTEAMQSTDDLLDLHYQGQSQRPVLDGVEYDFGQVLLGSQWHRRELMQPENDYFRWTGPQAKASIDFWLKRQNYRITVRIINAISTAVLNALQIKLNGEVLHWHTVDQGVVRVLEMECTAAMIADHGLARLTIDTGTVLSHQQAFASADSRLVGVAVHWIQFQHV